MKTTKTPKTNTRSRIIFFAIVLTYNLLLGLYLKDFLVISPIEPIIRNGSSSVQKLKTWKKRQARDKRCSRTLRRRCPFPH